uniref:NADH dehydrogenase [ubiquinone] 1 beta subcomplex subunit 5, mitochondrial n=1 Tax=Petromyzon marinus TaxID=7757 RepID=S4R9X9_PETMA
ASSSLFSAAAATASSSSAASATSPLRCLLGRVPAELTVCVVRVSGHVRYSSGSSKRLFFIEPTKYFDNRFLNLTIFYLALTGVPAAIIITYINVFVGEAKLAEIPEGYIPENYEYHKCKLEHWETKVVEHGDISEYEILLSKVFLKTAGPKLKGAIEAKARRLMRDRGDGPWSVMPVQDPTVIIRHHKATPDD